MNNIVINNDIRFGAPCISCTRISVADILGYIAGGDTIDTLVKNFPELTVEKVYSALTYASRVLNTTAYININNHEMALG